MKEFTKYDRWMIGLIVAVVVVAAALAFPLFFQIISPLNISGNISLGEIVVGLATVGLVFFAAIQISQAKKLREFEVKVQNANYAFSLFGLRSEVFVKIEQLIMVFLTEDKPEISAVAPLSDYLQKYQLGLPGEQRDYANLVVRNALKYSTNQSLYTLYVQREVDGDRLDPREIRVKDRASNTADEMIAWFIEQNTSNAPFNLFAPILKLPDVLEP